MTPDGSCPDCAAALARLATLEARLTLLEFSRPDRDRGAAAVRSALADIWPGGIVFSAQDVIDAIPHHPNLGRALEMALIDDAPGIGCWLRGHTGIHDEIVIQRHGRKWACYRCTSVDTCI